AVVRDCLSHERLEPYRRASSGDWQRAFALYEWNMLAAAAIMHCTSMVEVLVRNALDRELVWWATRKDRNCDWFSSIPLDSRGRGDLTKARLRASRNGQINEAHGKVIAELNFGFWRYLVESR